MGVNPNETVRFDVIGDFNGTDEIVQSYQFRNFGGVAITSQQALDDFIELFTALWAILGSLHQVLTIFRRIRGQNVDTGELLGVQSFAAPLAGNQASQPLATQTTAVLSFPTTIPRVILKKMFGPMSEDQIGSVGTFNPATEATLTATGVFLLTLYNATNTQWQYGYKSPKTLAFEVPTGAQYITSPGARRSRKIGLGS